MTLPLRVAWLANFVPPYAGPLFHELASRVESFRVFTSVPMEPNRSWPVRRNGFDVKEQRTITVRSTWRHPHGFEEPIYVHIPYDTVQLLSKFRPDVVISGELGIRTLLAVAYRRWRPRSRLIIRATLSEETEKRRDSPRKMLRHLLLSQSDAVVVNGQSGASYLRGFSVPEERVHCIPSTTDLDPFLNVDLRRSEREAHRLLYCGQLVPRKGLGSFITHLQNWCKNRPDRRVGLHVAGEGPERLILERMSRPTNLDIKFLGPIPYEDLPRLYCEAGILVFPTLADEWGLVVNEALASGVPVLGSLYSQAVQELVKDGVNGWTFHPDQLQETHATLDRALNTSREELDEMRIAARSAIRHLTPGFVASRILEVVHTVCSS